MDSISNPYTPNAGAAPEIVVGRDDQLEAFTVLLRRLERAPHRAVDDHHRPSRGRQDRAARPVRRDRARRPAWEVVEIEASKHDDARFRQTMFSQLKSALLRLSPAGPLDRARPARGGGAERLRGVRRPEGHVQRLVGRPARRGRRRPRRPRDGPHRRVRRARGGGRRAGPGRRPPDRRGAVPRPVPARGADPGPAQDGAAEAPDHVRRGRPAADRRARRRREVVRRTALHLPGHRLADRATTRAPR